MFVDFFDRKVTSKMESRGKSFEDEEIEGDGSLNLKGNSDTTQRETFLDEPITKIETEFLEILAR